MEKKQIYDISAIKHVGNRIKIRVDNLSTNETYNLDFTQEDFKVFKTAMEWYEIIGEFQCDSLKHI